jgi:hypothetical protein
MRLEELPEGQSLKSELPAYANGLDLTRTD